MSIDVDDTPLTDEELEALLDFFCKHHPPCYEELVMMQAKGLLPSLPILLRLYWEEMERFQSGKPTRHLEFLP